MESIKNIILSDSPRFFFLFLPLLASSLRVFFYPVSNRVRLLVRGYESGDGEIWVLLTRHINGKHEKPLYISLNVTLHENLQRWYSAEKPLVQVSGPFRSRNLVSNLI